jgi:hypothetical protein
VLVSFAIRLLIDSHLNILCSNMLKVILEFDLQFMFFMSLVLLVNKLDGDKGKCGVRISPSASSSQLGGTIVFDPNVEIY